MRHSFHALTTAVATVVLAGCAEERVPLPVLDSALETELTGWLDEHGQPPLDYVLSKFADHDIVILGEFYRVRHDVMLVQDVIRRLPEVGVRVVGLEYLGRAQQDSIDALLQGREFDEDLARRLFWDQWPWWGYLEYVEILRVAWETNQDLPRRRRIRVLGLAGQMDWSHVWNARDRQDPVVMSRVFSDGDLDKVMAETVQEEIISKRQKALVYTGINHAFTRFRQPVYNAETGEVRHISARMGNRIYNEIGDRVFMIFLHSPWPPVTGFGDPVTYAADGVIDALMAKRPPESRAVGFDLTDSPFGELPAETSYWSHAADTFQIDMFSDGWIYQKPLWEYEGVTVIDNWFNSENRLEAIAQMSTPDPRVKNQQQTVEALMGMLRADSDFPRRFARFAREGG